MKNKKYLIIGLIIIAIIALILGISITKSKVGDFLFSTDGTLVDGHKDLIEHLKNIDDPSEREKQINFSLEKNIITQEEANELY